MSRLSKRLCRVAEYFESQGHSDLAVIADVTCSINEGNPRLRGEALHIQAAPTHLAKGDRVIVSVKYNDAGLGQGSIGRVMGGDGSNNDPFKIKFGKRTIEMGTMTAKKHLIKVTQRVED